MIRNRLKNLAFMLILCFISFTYTSAQWTPVASPPEEFQTDHTYGFGLDGKGYLVTGTDQYGAIRNDFFQYDPIADEFTQLDDFPGGARGFAIGDNWDGKAYFGFGSDDQGPKNDLWVFDPSTEDWTELASCPCEARNHPAFVAQNNKIFLGLGSGASGNLRDWWIYDIPTDTWVQGPNFPSFPRHHPYQFGIDDNIYVGFGHGDNSIYNTWYQYSITDDLWTKVKSLPSQGRVAGQQFSWNGMGFILSGEGNQHTAMEEGEFWSYDPIEDSWEQLPSHPNHSRWAPVSFVIDNEVYMFNGVVYGFGPTEYIYEAYKYRLGDDLSATSRFENELNITIHPNPAKDYLTIEGKDNATHSGNYSIYDVLGNKLMHFDIDGQIELDLTDFTNGVYILSSNEDKASTRFVIAR